MSSVITHNKETLNEILNRLDDNQHEIALCDLTTEEIIYLDDTLKKIIKMYYQNIYQTCKI
ncbi:hypothetical protein [Clostridium omnivorum]|uniref:Spo0E family sporulation regulatory protein-aspartic acid phosphatase n=1 Tax=Clostridium omnivorum TaxID=1604902 RepID=A0ABQ5NCA6_9CLOT|nr:hypothetical protein [Clostridium sp. E14]GLC32908.1 hypothetical protein bsdE14_43180 [Clostridium sp. E14]